MQSGVRNAKDVTDSALPYFFSRRMIANLHERMSRRSRDSHQDLRFFHSIYCDFRITSNKI